MHHGDSLECGHYVSYFFYTKTGTWWHCYDDDITGISYFPEGVYTRESHKKKLMSGSDRIFLVVNIRTSNLTASIYFHKYSYNMPNINHIREK